MQAATGVISCYSGAISCYRTISHPGLIPGGPKGSNLAPGGTAPLWIKTVALDYKNKSKA